MSYVGQYSTEEAAARAYDEAARRLLGASAPLNLPTEAPPQGPAASPADQIADGEESDEAFEDALSSGAEDEEENEVAEELEVDAEEAPTVGVQGGRGRGLRGRGRGRRGRMGGRVAPSRGRSSSGGRGSGQLPLPSTTPLLEASVNARAYFWG